MARIRTIKPDFWTDEKLVECSIPARLLFIGIWNFADDNGNLIRSAKKIKMQVFPADIVDCEPLIIELIGQRVLLEYSVNDEKYLHIKGFKKHQVINKPSKSSIPLPDDYGSATVEGRESKADAPTPLPEDYLTERKGIGKGKNITTTVTNSARPHPVDKSAPGDWGNLPDKSDFINYFGFCLTVVEGMFGRKMHAKDQEHVSDWCRAYDMREALPVLETAMVDYRTKYGGLKSPPASYMTPVLKNKINPKTST